MKVTKLKKYLFTEIFNLRIKPETLQLPITGKCNSKCISCNIWKQDEKKDLEYLKLQKIIFNKYFNKVKNVGINGGEPFLHKDIVSIVETLILLPKLERIYLISNGLLTNKIKEELKKIYKIARQNKIKLYLTISLDGINDVYSQVRGIPNGFTSVNETITFIKENMSEYCDKLTLGTTVSLQNIDYLKEIENYAKSMKININFHIAVPNRRIYTNNDFERYSIFSDEKARIHAVEFFYGLFKKSKSLKEKLLYFQNYYYLENYKRISGCNYKKQDLTIDENLNLYYCAKESMVLGNLKEEDPKNILQSIKAKKEEKRIKKYCSQCGHYIEFPSIKGVFFMLKEILKPGIWLVYKLLSYF